jgi:hypothetical protein
VYEIVSKGSSEGDGATVKLSEIRMKRTRGESDIMRREERESSTIVCKIVSKADMSKRERGESLERQDSTIERQTAKWWKCNVRDGEREGICVSDTDSKESDRRFWKIFWNNEIVLSKNLKRAVSVLDDELAILRVDDKRRRRGGRGRRESDDAFYDSSGEKDREAIRDGRAKVAAVARWGKERITWCFIWERVIEIVDKEMIRWTQCAMKRRRAIQDPTHRAIGFSIQIDGRELLIRELLPLHCRGGSRGL